MLETFFSSKCNFITVVWHRETYGRAVTKLPKHPPEIFYSATNIFMKYLAFFNK